MQGPLRYQEPQNEDPHGYIATGKKRMNWYMMRQFWGMKWVTVAIVALMCLYTYTMGDFIPLLWPSLFNIGCWSVGWWLIWNGMTKSCIACVKLERTGDQRLPALYKHIGIGAWTLYVMQCVGLYWVIVISFLTFFFPEVDGAAK